MGSTDFQQSRQKNPISPRSGLKLFSLFFQNEGTFTRSVYEVDMITSIENYVRLQIMILL